MADYPLLDACDPQPCFSSRILKCNRIIATVFRKHLIQFDLTNSQLSLLFILAKRGPLKQVELSEHLYLEKSSLSRNLRRLLERGYIAKEAVKVIDITEKGKAFLERVIPAWNRAMEESRELLGEDGEAALTTVFTRLTQK